MQIVSNEKIILLKEFIEKHDFFFIAGHKEPDGDCVYSCLAFSRILNYFKKEYQLLNAGSFKRNEIYDKAELFSDVPQFLSEPERKKTGLFILDCSELKRLGDLENDLKGLDTFTIDHHITAEETPYSIIDPSSPATACIVQQIYEKIIGELNPEVANEIFFGQSTDTGYFRFLDEKSEEVFLQTARLVKAGVNPRKMYDKITGGKLYNTRKLLGVLLAKSEQYYGGKLIITYETMEDTKKFGMDGRDSDSLYSLLLAVENVEAVIFIRQDTEYSCTVGLRSKDKVDVSSIAQKFGGGGHKNAAGLSIQGTISTVLPSLQKEFSKIFK